MKNNPSVVKREDLNRIEEIVKSTTYDVVAVYPYQQGKLLPEVSIPSIVPTLKNFLTNKEEPYQVNATRKYVFGVVEKIRNNDEYKKAFFDMVKSLDGDQVELGIIEVEF